MSSRILPTPSDYTDKDFESMNRRIDLLLDAVFPAWTDKYRGSFGNILKELFCFSMDVTTYYQDQQAIETRWGTAVRRESIIELARLIAYTLSGASAATVDVVFSISAVAVGDVIIPAGTIVKTVGGGSVIRFQTLAAATITAGNLTSNTVSAENSESHNNTFTAEGDSNEDFILSQTPFLDGSQSVLISADVWTKVDDFLDSGPTDKHYLVRVDDNDRATIRVGDGTNGAIASPGASVSVSYKIGGGEAGNVESSTITKIEGGPFYDTLSNRVNLSVSNTAAASGGANRETVEEARYAAPKSLRVLNRAVARTDFEDVAEQVTSVARSLMLTKIEDATIEAGRGRLYIVPEGGGVPSAQLKTDVSDYITNNYPPPLTFDYDVLDPEYLSVNVKAYVYLGADQTEATCETEALTALRAFFSPTQDDGTANYNVDFGFYYKDNDGDPDPKVSLSSITNLINDLSSVRRLGTPGDGEGITLNGSQDDVDLTLRQFPEGGTLELWNGDTSTKFAGHPVSI